MCPKLRYFLKVGSLAFSDIAQDRSFGQCLTSSRAEASKKKKKKIVVEIGAEMMFSVLMLLSVHSNLLVFQKIRLGKISITS